MTSPVQDQPVRSKPLCLMKIYQNRVKENEESEKDVPNKGTR